MRYAAHSALVGQSYPNKDQLFARKTYAQSEPDITHRDDGQRFIVRADEGLTAFIELESVIRDSTKSFYSNWRLML